jgi:uncharacterized metal-binding protein YceD (DUF177 family)
VFVLQKIGNTIIRRHTMKIRIQGLAEGKHTIHEQRDSSAIDGMFSEFFGVVILHGLLQRIKSQFVFRCTVECSAHLVCDRSGEEFEERIAVPLTITCIADTERFLLQQKEFDPEPPLYVRTDDKFIDLTDEVRQSLALALPMKRVAPQYRDMDFEDILHTTHEDADESFNEEPRESTQKHFVADERWSALRNIKFDQPLENSKRKN